MAVKNIQNPGDVVEARARGGCCHCHHERRFYEEIFPEFREMLVKNQALNQALTERFSANLPEDFAHDHGEV